jgi:hypothetical protein
LYIFSSFIFFSSFLLLALALLYIWFASVFLTASYNI